MSEGRRGWRIIDPLAARRVLITGDSERKFPRTHDRGWRGGWGVWPRSKKDNPRHSSWQNRKTFMEIPNAASFPYREAY